MSVAAAAVLLVACAGEESPGRPGDAGAETAGGVFDTAAETAGDAVEHPLQPRPLGSANNPIPTEFSTPAVNFRTAGFFPYQCPEHVAAGMLGVIWVQP